ncbi:hypothetical protein V2G26_008298 [Clonostachys chloroleuca]
MTSSFRSASLGSSQLCLWLQLVWESEWPRLTVCIEYMCMYIFVCGRIPCPSRKVLLLACRAIQLARPAAPPELITHPFKFSFLPPHSMAAQ